MSEHDGTRRVVLLARPGLARERMREAVTQAGGTLVLEADPTAADPAEVAAARPDVALIVLDAATDEALDRFDALLSDPSVEVLFEEAELAVGRAGWDAARWVRHLSAKLHRSGDVLPPGAEAAQARSTDGVATPQPASPAAVEPPPLPDRAPVAASLAVEVPPLPEPAPIANAPVVEPPPLPEVGLEWTPSVPENPPQPATAAPAQESSLILPDLEPTGLEGSGPASILSGLELPALDEPASADARPGFQSTFDVNGDLDDLAPAEITLAPLQLDEEFLSTSSEGIAPLEGLELPGDVNAGLGELPGDFNAAAVPAAVEAPPLPTPRFTLALVDDDEPAPAVEGEEGADAPAVADRFHNDLTDLHNRIASMELVVDRAPSQVRGAVLVLAGIGGPDAVRQLLGALPNDFPRAVLVQQRLDGGHYDKLVAQMQRATQLLVELATAGRALQPSSVYILSPGIGVASDEQGLRFTDEPGDLLDALPAGDSAVLMLSGSDPAQVDAVMKLSGSGALVAAQALDGCYDVAAPAALAARGGTAAKPQDMARSLAARWAA